MTKLTFDPVPRCPTGTQHKYVDGFCKWCKFPRPEAYSLPRRGKHVSARLSAK